jgi:AAA ATPase domain
LLNHTKLASTDVEINCLSNINILMGRNGSGKSRFLRSLASGLRQKAEYETVYISPERSGVFKRDGSVETNLASAGWLDNVRTQNQASEFKSVSASYLHKLELLYLRRMESSPELRHSDRNFKNDQLDKINRLLSNLILIQEGSDFVFRTHSEERVEPNQISSGESEAVALASEIIHFFETVVPQKFNVPLLDEPDVHLHPDLQARLADLLINEFKLLPKEKLENVIVILATHSTPLVCALAKSQYTSIGTKEFGVDKVNQAAANTELKKVAPFFGHPLSMAFNNAPLLILEGEDDERVWQQAARSSQGRIKLFPILATSVDSQTELETFCSKVLPTMYDSPIAYSLRDGDNAIGLLNNLGSVLRFRLQCYAIENTLVSNQCLAKLGTDWSSFITLAKTWLTKNPEHRDCFLVQEMIESTDRLKQKNIKVIRSLIVNICGSQKPWEVVVGQTIGTIDEKNLPTELFSICDFIGIEALQKLLGRGYGT